MPESWAASELDERLVRRRFDRAARIGTAADPLSREVARRMHERLDYLRIDPGRVLDLGCGTGPDFAALHERFPRAQIVGVDFSLASLTQLASPAGSWFHRWMATPRRRVGRVCASARRLPLPDASIGLAWSNLMLNWLGDPLPALKEIHRVMDTGGALLFSCFGPDTLRELRTALTTTSGERVHRFPDMHDVGDALIGAGFSDPVMDMELLTVTYPDLDTLLSDLKGGGCTNASRTRPRGLSGRSAWTSARRQIESQMRDGRLPVSFEVVQGHAWKEAPRQNSDGGAIVRFHPRQARD